MVKLGYFKARKSFKLLKHERIILYIFLKHMIRRLRICDYFREIFKFDVIMNAFMILAIGILQSIKFSIKAFISEVLCLRTFLGTFVVLLIMNFKTVLHFSDKRSWSSSRGFPVHEII